MDIAVVGAGIFGMSSAVELSLRNHRVTVFEQGQVPNELASSTDVGKIIRRTHYLPTEPYIEMVEIASQQWKKWDELSAKHFYYQIGGLTGYKSSELVPGSIGYESIPYLKDNNTEIELLSIKDVEEKFPQFVFSEQADQQFIYDPWAGYLDSGQVLTFLAQLAVENGVEIKKHCRVLDVQDLPTKVSIGIDGVRIPFDRAVIAAGPWISRLAPEISGHLSVTKQQMAFFKSLEEIPFQHVRRMPYWAFNPYSARTEVESGIVDKGWYGWPILQDGTFKIAMDLVGEEVDPDVPRKATSEFIEKVKEFLANHIPILSDWDFVSARSCLYTNTTDGHFIIDWKPGSDRILLAGGGSGHGFKFGGVIGEMISNTLEDRVGRFDDFFRIGDRFTETN